MYRNLDKEDMYNAIWDFPQNLYDAHKIGNNILTLVFNILYNTTFTDIYSCYLCFKRELIDVDKLKTDGFDQHAEILSKSVKKGTKFYEVPISYYGRNYNEGKKITFKDAFIAVYCILKYSIIS